MVFNSDYPKFDQEAPDDFDPAKPYADPVAFFEQREFVVREKLIQVEKAKILREKLRQCYWKEGVNHYQKCRPLVQKYMASCQNIGWGKDARPSYLNHL
ncbi:NADH dehydrogenase [ubiquinone] 1 beta subcomplex subunit 10-B [Physcomitrium patens]